MAARHAHLCTLALLALAGRSPAVPEVTITSPAGLDAAVYSPCEVALDVRGDWANPYDPDQADVVGQVTTPGGRTYLLPAFYHQPHEATVLQPQEARRQVELLKFFLTERDWPRSADLTFYLDDVVLLNSTTGEALVVADGESQASPAGGTLGGAALSRAQAHSGQGSVAFHPEIAGEENWPGAVWGFAGVDWSVYDQVSLWIYPDSHGFRGPCQLYFHDRRTGNSPIPQWTVGSPSMQPERWNHLVWDWRSFPRDVAFTPTGAAGWRFRFTPTEPGLHRLTVTARDHTGAASSAAWTVTAKPSDLPGFVRVSKSDPHYFAFDNGQPFYGIGHDVPSNVGDALAFFPKMQAAGENCTYLIMYPNKLAIEWPQLGVYDQRAAAALDWYLAQARQHGLRVKLSFDEHCVNRPSRDWGPNPYNAAQGGPCGGVNEFYTSPAARQQYRKRLRYILARWAADPTILAWEYFAEIDGATALGEREGWRYPDDPKGGEISAMLVDWLTDMSRWLRANDPYQHLITESFGSGVSDPAIWSLPEIEYTQIHQYNVGDVAGSLGPWAQQLTRDYAKPMMVTEFGWGVQAASLDTDPDGACLHHGIWATMMGGAAATAMTWWCRRVDELNLYRHYAAAAAFAAGMDWPSEQFKPAQVAVHLPPPDHYRPVQFVAQGPFSGATVERFVLQPDGTVNDPQQLAGTLLASGRPEPRVNPELVVDCPQPTHFSVRVDSVSPDARLEISVDGQPVLTTELPAQVEGKPCVFDAQWQVWRCTYDQDFGVDLPAGRHVVRLENTKGNGSWIRLRSYTLSDYGPPNLRVLGLSGRTQSILWLQNQDSALWDRPADNAPDPLRGASVALQVPTPGTYSVDWWDTYLGRLTSTERVVVTGTALQLALPPLDRDVACRVRYPTP